MKNERYIFSWTALRNGEDQNEYYFPDGEKVALKWPINDLPKIDDWVNVHSLGRKVLPNIYQCSYYGCGMIKRLYSGYGINNYECDIEFYGKLARYNNSVNDSYQIIKHFKGELFTIKLNEIDSIISFFIYIEPHIKMPLRKEYSSKEEYEKAWQYYDKVEENALSNKIIIDKKEYALWQPWLKEHVTLELNKDFIIEKGQARLIVK